MSEYKIKSIWRDLLLVKIIIGILFLVVIIFAFKSERPVPNYGDEFRIFYFHVPCAFVSFLAFFVNLIYSIRYLRGKSSRDDIKASSAAEIGLVFGVLATLTGAIFAKISWGEYWNWDVRQTTIAILLAIYAAYFALRSAIDAEERRASFASVYALLAFIAVPLFGIIIPRLYPSLHPSSTIMEGGRVAMGGNVALIFAGSLIAFTLLFFWLFNLRWRANLLERILKESSYE